MKYINTILPAILLTLSACNVDNESSEAGKESVKSWHTIFDEQLQLSGHRNWILVVDKAFPQQPGMQIINTGQKLLPVLEAVLSKLRSSTHVKPIIFKDAELQYITDSLTAGVNKYKADLGKLLDGFAVYPLLHDSVFVKMEASAKLFSITVLKTEEVIPYSSVFIQLDCAYWGKEQELKLREIMKNSSNQISN